MNNAQRTVLIMVVVGMTCMTLYPPWVNEQSGQRSEPMGYGFIWKPPHMTQEEKATLFGIELSLSLNPTEANSIDFSRLVIQYIVLAVVAFGSITLLGLTRQRAR